MVATERRDSYQEPGHGWAGLVLHRTTPQTALSLVKVGRRGVRKDTPLPQAGALADLITWVRYEGAY